MMFRTPAGKKSREHRNYSATNALRALISHLCVLSLLTLSRPSVAQTAQPSGPPVLTPHSQNSAGHARQAAVCRQPAP
jgi:hypothetical protein